MFDKLQNRFSKIFKTVKGHGKISEKNISEAIREIRRALLESDVNIKVVSIFIKKVKEKALGAKVLDSITPGQQFVKIVKDELIKHFDTPNIVRKNLEHESSIFFVSAYFAWVFLVVLLNFIALQRLI